MSGRTLSNIIRAVPSINVATTLPDISKGTEPRKPWALIDTITNRGARRNAGTEIERCSKDLEQIHVALKLGFRQLISKIDIQSEKGGIDPDSGTKFRNDYQAAFHKISETFTHAAAKFADYISTGVAATDFEATKGRLKTSYDQLVKLTPDIKYLIAAGGRKVDLFVQEFAHYKACEARVEGHSEAFVADLTKLHEKWQIFQQLLIDPATCPDDFRLEEACWNYRDQEQEVNPRIPSETGYSNTMRMQCVMV